jgi:hypothetical protein
MNPDDVLHARLIPEIGSGWEATNSQILILSLLVADQLTPMTHLIAWELWNDLNMEKSVEAINT